VSELSGSLEVVGLAPLVQFLASLAKTGTLRISRHQWAAQLGFEGGVVTAADADSERGPDALEFIVLALSDGDFAFASGAPPSQRNLEMRPTDLLARIEGLGKMRSGRVGAALAPNSVPRMVEAADDDAETEVVLTRASLAVLLQVDGRRTVQEIVDRRGLARSVKELLRLVDYGLVVLEPAADRRRPPPTGPDAPPAASAPPARPDGRQQSPGAQPWWRIRPRGLSRALGVEVAQGVAVTAALVLGARAIVQNFRIDGTSMEPNFQAGQVLIINKAAYFHVEDTPLVLARLLPTTAQGSVKYLFGGPRRGDVVVFHAPPEPDTDFIKRVIGLPGDRVLVRNGQVLVNDQPVVEPEIHFRANYTYPVDSQPLVVPADSYFVLGDNRPISFDSHTGWVVPASALVGQAWVTYWPPSAWRYLPGDGLVEPGTPNLQAADGGASAR